MEATLLQRLIARTLALIIFALFSAWCMLYMSAHTLAKMDSMSPAAYVVYRRSLYQHSYTYDFAVLLIMGVFCLGAIDAITYLILFVMPKKRKAQHPVGGDGSSASSRG